MFFVWAEMKVGEVDCQHNFLRWGLFWDEPRVVSHCAFRYGSSRRLDFKTGEETVRVSFLVGFPLFSSPWV